MPMLTSDPSRKKKNDEQSNRARTTKDRHALSSSCEARRGTVAHQWLDHGAVPVELVAHVFSYLSIVSHFALATSSHSLHRVSLLNESMPATIARHRDLFQLSPVRPPAGFWSKPARTPQPPQSSMSCMSSCDMPLLREASLRVVAGGWPNNAATAPASPAACTHCADCAEALYGLQESARQKTQSRCHPPRSQYHRCRRYSFRLVPWVLRNWKAHQIATLLGHCPAVTRPPER